jgi:serine/threonine-protein kinase
MTPRLFGPYELQELIGVGGMGEVWRARDARRERLVALKLLPEQLGQDQDFLNRFKRESHVAARLREPHVIPIHDYGEIAGRLYIDMRLVDGRDLSDILKDGPIPPARAVALLGQVADALDAAHADGLVHRDIKPSNILVTPNDFVYVVDFGIARSIGSTRSSLTLTGATVGTLDYMAPERFANAPLDGRVDVYSLACVLAECLTSKPPFAGDSLATLLYAHLYSDPPRPSLMVPGIPPELDDVIQKGMAKRPEDRYESPAELIQAARNALRSASETTPDVVPPPREPVRPPAEETTAVPAAPAAWEPPLNVGLRSADSGHNSVEPLPTPAMSGGTVLDEPSPERVSTGPNGWGQPVAEPAEVAPPPWQAAAAPWQAPEAPPWQQPEAPPWQGQGAPWQGGPGGPGGGSGGPGGPGGPGGESGPRRTTSPDGRRRRRLVIVSAVVALLIAGVLTVVLWPPARDFITGGGGKPAATSARGGPSGGAGGPSGGASGSQSAPPSVAPQIATSLAVPTVEGDPIPVNATPGFMAVRPDGKQAYIANRDTGVVTVFDTTLDRATGTIPIEAGPPWFITFSPDGRRAYITVTNAPDFTKNFVVFVNTQTNEVIDTFKVGLRPFAPETSPDGKILYVPLHNEGRVEVFDTQAAKEIGSYPVPPNPHWITVSRDGAIGYTANHESGVVTVLDLAHGGKVLTTIKVGTAPHSISLSPDGRQVSVCNFESNNVSVIDVASRKVVATIPVGQNPQDLTYAPDGRHIYTANNKSGSVSVIDTQTDKVTATLPLGTSPSSVAVLPDGTKAYVTDLDSGTVRVLQVGDR